MKLTYLGTAAAEGFPAVFCNCEHCQKARILGGKNIRTRSQALINDDLLLDLPADTYYHFLENKIEGDKIKYLFITHSHADHLYPSELQMRCGAYAHNMREQFLQLYCGKGAYEKIHSTVGIPQGIIMNVLKPYQTVIVGDYEVTALPARHMQGDEALIYIIRSDKTILYAHDTGYFFEEVFTFIKENSIVFDMVSLDCTNILIPIADDSAHMGLDNIGRLLERLENIGAVTDKTIKYVNHFSHNANPQHIILKEYVAKYGCSVAYDGCCVQVK